MRWPWAHTHKHLPVDVQTVERTGYGCPVTIILYRCACGDNSAQQLLGTWTLDQVRGSSSHDEVKSAVETLTK